MIPASAPNRRRDVAAASAWLVAAVVVAQLGSRGCLALFNGPRDVAIAGTDAYERAAVTMPIPVIDFALTTSWPIIALAIGSIALVALFLSKATVPLAALLGSKLRAVLFCQLVGGLAIGAFAVTLNPDAYAYVIYGRLAGVHGVNPYACSHSLGPLGDSILSQPLALWGKPPPRDIYGPLWTLGAAGLSRLFAGSSLAAQFALERAVAVVASAATIIALFRIFRLESATDGLRRANMAAFAPLVLLETALNGHNDMVMVAFGAWAFALAEIPVAAGLLLGASIAVKYLSIIAAPFLIIRILNARGKVAALQATAAATIVLWLSFVPFWIGRNFFAPLLGGTGNIHYSVAALIAAVLSLPTEYGHLAKLSHFGYN
ncbi:MAG TPA: hypothetical protein VGD50_03270, partial [Candidatus Baltobacteraceae bacterium]